MNFHLQIFPKTVVDEVLPHSLSRIMYSARTIYCACATYFCCIFCLFLLMEVGWGGVHLVHLIKIKYSYWIRGGWYRQMSILCGICEHLWPNGTVGLFTVSL